ncbi:hypothetical protein [Haloarchaeobius sp. HRN-SO-5]|uniref:hypothetical protein n=1 Tax=Haloarchaeobius sp. HRN-SO-5 TaxID=3446118 RepID=UPI003EB91537
MRRRSLLASLGAGVLTVSGCTTLDSDPGTGRTDSRTDATTTPTATESDPEDDGRDRVQSRTSLVDLDTTNRTYALTPTHYRSPDDASVTVQFTSTATADHPATVEATLTNANPFENTFDLSWLPPFGRYASRIPHRFGRRYHHSDLTYRVGLLFVPTENHDLVDDAPPVERTDDGLWRLASGEPSLDDWAPETHRLAPDETLHGEYVLVGHPDGAGRGRPPGVYQFRSRDDVGLRLAVWDTDAPGPGTTSRFAGTDVPEFGQPREGDRVYTTWYHDADESTRAYVRPSTERGTLPEQVRFTFVNKSREATRCGHWNLYKLVDDSWYHVGPFTHTTDCRIAVPGEAVTWTLNAYPGEALPTSGGAYDVGYLGGGRYAAVAGYGHDSVRSAALVELTGDAVELVPTEGVTSSRSGTTVTVTSPRYEDGERPPSATLTLTRTDADPERTLVREQVMRRRFRGLRNTLPFLDDDVEAVVLRTDEGVGDQVVGYDSDRLTFGLDGQAYRVDVDRT